MQQPAPVSPPHQPAPLSSLQLSPDQASPPRIPNAEIPPPLPAQRQNNPIIFEHPIIVQGPVARGDAPIRINRPLRNINLPLFRLPNDHFYQLVEQHGLSHHQLTLDLALRCMFLRNGDLFPNQILCVFENVPHAYESNSPYLRALAILALDSYTNEQVVAILYCVSHLTRRALINFIDRI